MGQYEPNDSRNVTLKQGHEPGGLERTGPREGEARQQAEQSQSQSQGDSSQSQSQSGADARSALDDPAGDPRPEYDQYAVNQPDSMNKESADVPEAQAAYGNSQDEDGRMEQPRDRDDQQRRQQAERQERAGDGDGIVGETSGDPAERARADAQRPLSD